MTSTSAPRLQLVDALRGFAVAQMIVYHFIYDLAYFGWVNLAMTRDQPWIAWRSAIVTQFLLLVGVSLVLRTSFKPSAADFWKRWTQIAAAALLVSIGSWLVFGQRFIYFGILHFVAAALLLARPLLRLKAWNIVAGIACIAIGVIYTNEF
ncbi:MAG TPA: heparan-alpha-glucosaminide N-acetyltransferase domain-containing protein, partial [Burkholderiaceae bacterium]|nr:heparan-alpha-glucosaminide N-acetyltransferase domain-containing protein [Burkholderiaceae bacterium]